MLLSAHNLKKDSLAQKLGNAASAESCLSIIAEYLSEFAAPDGEAVKSFKNPKQAVVACDILNIYISQIGRLSNLFKTRLVQIGTKPVASPENETTDEANNADGTILGIGSAAVIGGLMTNPVLGVPLALAGGLLALKLARSSEELYQETGISNPANVSEAGVRIDAKDFLDGLDSLFNSIDTLVQGFDETTSVTPTENLNSEADSLRKMTFAQQILGWYQQYKSQLPEEPGQNLGVLLDQGLPALFSGQNVQVRYFDASAGAEQNLFDTNDVSGESSHLDSDVLLPALFIPGGPILRGRALHAGRAAGIAVEKEISAKPKRKSPKPK